MSDSSNKSAPSPAELLALARRVLQDHSAHTPMVIAECHEIDFERACTPAVIAAYMEELVEWRSRYGTHPAAASNTDCAEAQNNAARE